MKQVLLFLAVLAPLVAQTSPVRPRPLDNPLSRQTLHELKPLQNVARLYLHRFNLDHVGVSIRLVKKDDLPENVCGIGMWDLENLFGQILVLRSDEYKGTSCGAVVSVKVDQKNTVVHELIHLVYGIPASEEYMITALANAMVPVQRRAK